MYKQDILDYVRQSSLLTRANGESAMLAEMLGLTRAAITYWPEKISIQWANKLHKLFKDAEFRKKWGLPAKGAPKFDLDLYE